MRPRSAPEDNEKLCWSAGILPRAEPAFANR